MTTDDQVPNLRAELSRRTGIPQAATSAGLDDEIRRTLIQAEYGTPAEQKDKLVDDILATCSQPELWPLTDAERVTVLRRWCQMARRIRHAPA